jgi:hypothetical protein
MSTAIATANDASIVESVIAAGDLSKLPAAQRTQYYAAVCNSLGLNPLTKPFEYITLNGKLTLYARKDATDQLRKLHSVSVHIASRERIDDVYTVTARATDARGRTDESIGAVAIGSLKGDALCNAIMKAETKAKRRVTLSICGLGMLDEAELETIPQPVRLPGDAAGDSLPFPISEPRGGYHETLPERPVQLEGAQPTNAPTSTATKHILAQIALLQWDNAKVHSWMAEEFNIDINPDNLAEVFDSFLVEHQRKIFAALKAEVKQ